MSFQQLFCIGGIALFVPILFFGADAKGPQVPLGLLPIQFPKENPYSPEKVELGKLLYFDKRLSSDNTVSCASCHHPNHAFTDGEENSKGIRGQRGGRSAPTVQPINAAIIKRITAAIRIRIERKIKGSAYGKPYLAPINPVLHNATKR